MDVFKSFLGMLLLLAIFSVLAVGAVWIWQFIQKKVRQVKEKIRNFQISNYFRDKAIEDRARQHSIVYVKNLSLADSQFEKIYDEDAQAKGIQIFQNTIFILTNSHAPNFKVIKSDLTKKTPNFKTVIREQPNQVLQDFQIVGGKLVLKYIKDVSNILEVRTVSGDHKSEIKVTGKGTIDRLVGRPDENILYFNYNSFLQPWEILKANVNTGQSKLQGSRRALKSSQRPRSWPKWSICSENKTC